MKGNDNARRGLRLRSSRTGQHAARPHLARTLALLSALAIAGGTMVAVVGTASAAAGGIPGNSGNSGDNGNTKVKICHRTEANGNANNPYTTNNVSTSSTDAEGHSIHTGSLWTPQMQVSHDADPSNPDFVWGDIIPPTDGFPSGLNWTVAGQAIWENGCTVPSDDDPDTTTFTVTKQWVVGEATIADNTEDGMVPGSLTVNGEAATWGAAIAWDGEGWPDVAEANDAVLADEDCTVVRHSISHGEVIVQDENNVITVTNYVTCDSDDETTSPGTTPVTTTTTTTTTTAPTTTPTPAIVVQPTSTSVETPAPVIVVEGVSQELPPAPAVTVKPAAQVEAAPSANAHTGQGQSPWMYLLFGAGALLMLGAWRAKRHESA